MTQEPSKKIKIIFARPVGMFSLFHQVLEHIVLSQKEGSTPLVYFNDYSLFWSSSGHNGARNVWEYYFYPVSSEKIEDHIKIPLTRLEHADIWEFKNREPNQVLPRRVAENMYGNIDMPDNAYVTNLYEGKIIPWVFDISPRKRRKLGEIIRTHIRIKEPILEKIEHFFNRNMKEHNVLGIHMRGGEHSDEREFYVKGGFLPIDYYVREIDAYLHRHPEAKIYAASDVEDNIEQLKKRYPDKVMTYQATRLSRKDETIGLHGHPDYNKALLGEEVIVETLLLSKCHFLIHGPSNVSAAAMLFNPSLLHVNIYKKYGMAFSKLRYDLKNLVYRAKIVLSRSFPKTYAMLKSFAHTNS